MFLTGVSFLTFITYTVEKAGEHFSCTSLLFLQRFCFIRRRIYNGKLAVEMGREAKCKLGKKTSPTQTQWCFLPLLSFVPVPSVVCSVVRQYTETQGGINLGKEQPN